MTEILFETAENPIPEGARPGWLVTSDGKKLRYALFPPTGRPIKGTVIILQGRNEYIEKYFETARELSSRGLFVLTFDLRGQGLSDRMLDDPKRGFVDSFEDYARDLELLIDEVALPDCRPPYYILGHSTGSLVALLAAPRLTNRIRRMVLSAPLIELAGVPFSPSTLRFLVGMLFNIGLGRMYLAGGPPGEPTPFATNTLTTDYERFMRNRKIVTRHPELALGGPTVTWIRAACQAADLIREDDFLARITVPTLMIAAGADADFSIIDPAEEKLKAEFAGVQRLLLPMHAVMRIEEVEKRGQNKILEMDGTLGNVTPFPLPPTDGRSR